jgi:hypothetical protein
VVELNPPADRLGSSNALLLGRGRRHFVREFPGPLSIKHVVEGRVVWKLGRREIPVDEQSFLILHDGEPYSMDLELPRPARTCCVFFARGFAEDAARALTRPEVSLLDEPEASVQPLTYLSQLHREDARIVPRLQALAQAFNHGTADALWSSEQFLALAKEMVLLQGRRQAAVGSAAGDAAGDA